MEEQKEIKWRRQDVEKFITSTEEAYKVKFSKRLQEKLLDNGKPEALHHIDSIVAEWRIWEPYVEKNDFVLFLEDGIISLYSCQCNATTSVATVPHYIGNRGVKVEKALPTGLYTINRRNSSS